MRMCFLAAAASTTLLAGPSVLAQTPPPANAAPAAVPVSVASASRRDVPEYLRGLGTVQAYRSVLVRARVDGTLEQIAYREGQTVKPGDLLAVIDPRPYAATLAQARAKRAADAAQLANATVDLGRYASLAQQSFASRQQLDTQRATVAADGANLQADDAAIAAAALNLSFCRIESPIEGVVGLKQVDIGNLVHASDANGLVTITQVQPISLVFTLPETALPRVRDAMAAEGAAPPVLAYTSGENPVLLDRGTLLTPNNTVDTSTGTISLKATFPNAREKLWPGQFVEARVEVGVAHGAVTVPTGAIQHGPAGLYVYLVRPDDTVHRQPVQERFETEGAAVIDSGLAGGERVVTAGQSRLDEGVKIVAQADAGSGS